MRKQSNHRLGMSNVGIILARIRNLPETIITEKPVQKEESETVATKIEKIEQKRFTLLNKSKSIKW